jgi:transposase
MIGPGTAVRVYLAGGVTDMRKGIGGLSVLAQDVLRQNPTSGAVLRSGADAGTESNC